MSVLPMLALGGGPWDLVPEAIDHQATRDGFRQRRRTADGEASAQAKRLIQRLSDDDYDVRERATRDLIALGQPALRAIRDLNSRCPETQARCKNVRLELEGLYAVSRGWERDVHYLLRLDDPRARRRLDRIIGSAAERWTELHWDEALDRYVEGD